MNLPSLRSAKSIDLVRIGVVLGCLLLRAAPASQASPVFNLTISTAGATHLAVGRTRVLLKGMPFLIGIDVSDATTRTLARSRLTLISAGDSSRVRLSDLLVYRAGDLPASSLDSALARAVPGDTVTRDHAIGLFWETYGMANEGESVDLSLSVERVDHGWIRSARQRLKLG